MFKTIREMWQRGRHRLHAMGCAECERNARSSEMLVGLTELKAGPDGWGIAGNGIGAEFFCAVVASTFKELGGTNYVECHLKDKASDDEYTLMFQKRSGGAKTPHELKAEAEAALAEAKAALKDAWFQGHSAEHWFKAAEAWKGERDMLLHDRDAYTKQNERMGKLLVQLPSLKTSTLPPDVWGEIRDIIDTYELTAEEEG